MIKTLDLPGNRRVEKDAREQISTRSFDLQFFASAEDEGRTEDPTSKRKREARDDGQIPRTEELPTALLMASGFLVLSYYGDWMFFELRDFAREMMGLQRFTEVNPGNIHRILVDMIWICVKVIWPIAAATFIAGMAAHVGQVGFLWTTEPFKIDFGELIPSASDFMPSLSGEMLWDLAMSIIKVVTIGFVALEVIYKDFDTLLIALNFPLINGVKLVLEMAFEIIWKTVVILLILSPIDYAWQYYEWWDQLKMSPQQKDDEKKQREGDPEVKKKQQEKQREMSERRMAEEVPEADVVVTNPTHYAVALKFDEKTMEAPTVVAKGEGMSAQRIKSIAKEFDVPIYEIPLLARTLYQLELAREIPPVLYNAVAEILTWVHRNREDVPKQERTQLEQEVKELDLAPAG